MSDNLNWRNKHAVLLREPQWAGIAARENFRIRADLRPLFEAHPDCEDLLQALDERELYAEGCEFLARMMHRRVAVWWGYTCLILKRIELAEIEKGAKPAMRPDDARLDMIRNRAEARGIRIPDSGKTAAESLAQGLPTATPVPKVDWDRALETPKPPPQDEAPVRAVSIALRSAAAKIRSLVSPSLLRMLDESRAACVKGAGQDPQAAFAAARAFAERNPLTYTIDRSRSEEMRIARALPQQMDGRFDQLRDSLSQSGLVPPADPEGASLFLAERKRRLDEAMLAIWRWIVAPDARNTALALAAGNAVAGPEQMLAFAAAWSFGDLAPEGAQRIPVSPELPGTGVTKTLQLLALDPAGTRGPKERYEHFFKIGLEVVRGRILWPEEMESEAAPHEAPAETGERQRVNYALRNNGEVYAPTPELRAAAEAKAAELRARNLRRDTDLTDEEILHRVSVVRRAERPKESPRTPETLATVEKVIERVAPAITPYRKWSK